MSSSVLIFVLSIAGALIAALGTILWWFIRERMKAREQKEDTLERRLSSGSETMQRITTRIEALQNNQVEQFAKVVPQATFENYCATHKEDHKELDKRVHELRKGQDAVKDEVRGFGNKLDTGLGTITDLLAKVTTIPSDPKDQD